MSDIFRGFVYLLVTNLNSIAGVYVTFFFFFSKSAFLHVACLEPLSAGSCKISVVITFSSHLERN